VLPSNSPNEAFGLVLVEAMACGKPLVACALESGVPCVCRDGINGLIVPPNDAIGLAQALRRLLLDPRLQAQLGEGGRRLAQTEYASEVMVNRYWGLFESLLRQVTKSSDDAIDAI
jgi:rhamnosyl/mannosyltransferase